MDAWTPMKQVLQDAQFIVELTPDGHLFLENDYTKETFDLHGYGTYDLLLFLHEYAAAIYTATHRPKEIFNDEAEMEELLSSYQLVSLSVESGWSHAISWNEKILAADATDPLLRYVLALAQEWGDSAYNWECIVLRIEPMMHAIVQPDPVPAFLQELRASWQLPFIGLPLLRSWQCTIQGHVDPWDSVIPTLVLIHQYGQYLVIGSVSQGKRAAPAYLLLPEEDDPNPVDSQDSSYENAGL